MPFLTQHGPALRLAIQLAPRSSRDRIIGMHDGALKIAVTSPPIEGRANDHLIQFLSETLRLPKSSIALVQGETGRRKLIEISGASLEAVRRALVPG